MFWTFWPKENGLDDQGRIFNEAMIDHIKWCIDTLSDTNDYDLSKRCSASGELIDHFFQFIDVLGKEDGPKWKKIITEFLEERYKQPIEEILKGPTPLMEGNHNWQWMPFPKQ